MARTYTLAFLFIAVMGVLLLSALDPMDRTTWLLEASPVLAIAAIILCTHRHFGFSTFAYGLLALGGLALVIGAHYGFAHVPVGNWARDTFGLSRNHYDRVGHVLQGIIPAILAREWLLRGERVRGRRLLPFLCICVAMAVSAVYELAEWVAAITLGQSAEEFLGMQGDEWDTQADMACALFGAFMAMTLLVPLHDRSMAKLVQPTLNTARHKPAIPSMRERPSTESR
ncbi:DUF2238 domain-containing protein [Pseudomonas sp. Marseille-QA0892]